MTPERYQQIKRVFMEACQHGVAERAAYLSNACASDAALRAEVESLLAQDGKSLPVEPALSAAQVLGSSALSNFTGGMPGAGHPCADHLPERIGGYRVLRKVGEGGMGAVFEAEQDNPRRTIALKVIRPGIASEQVLRRFKLEAHVLGRLQHPGIAQIHEAGTAEMHTSRGLVTEQPFFAMEFIHGAPLNEYVRRQQLGIRARLELLAKVCDAVEHAHQHGVIHRDLKPGNILVDDTGQPKILDFGVARVTDTDVQVTTLRTDVGQLIGTIAYMSPEQVAGDSRAVDARSDVYALGVLIYQSLADRLPYELADKTIPEAARTIAADEPTPLSAINRIFRGDLTTITTKALEKEKTRRYASAAELARDLRRYAANEPIAARPASTLYHLRKFARRNPTFVGGVLTAFVILLLGIAGTASQAIRAARGGDRALAAESRAEQNRATAETQRAEAQRQAATLQTVNDFLTDDLLAAASPENEADRDITVREVLDRAAQTIGTRFKEQPLVEATIRATLAESYFELGEYKSAEMQASTALALRRAVLGDDHPLTLASMHSVGSSYASAGRYAEAEELLNQTVARQRRVLGPGHESTLRTMNALTLLYHQQRRDGEEEKLLQEIIALAQANLGDEHNVTLMALANLAQLYLHQSRFAEAERLFIRSLALARRVWGEEHIKTLSTMSNLANLYARQNRFAEAEPLCLKVLDIRRRVLGPDHPRTLISLNNLATLYKQQRRFAEAEPLYLQALEAKRRQLGEEHPNTLVSMNNLAGLYALQGRFAEAEPLFLKTVDVRQRVLGAEHPQTLSAIGNLAKMYSAQGRKEEAARWRAKLPTSRPTSASRPTAPESE